ncbi:MAG: TetR family transcriptional regulator [Actinomycetota bacterium]|nr:TetR family transcriptional regulator [Actinomycetota bacterium]
MPTPSLNPQDAAGAVLQAARLAFASRGYAQTTMKSVAVAAGVAPGVVKSLYSNKERLFAAAMRLPFDPAQAVPELIAPGLDGMGERLVRMTLALMGDESVRRDVTRVLRSDRAAAVSSSAAKAAGDDSTLALLRFVSEYLQGTVVDRVVMALGIPDARMRVTLISSYLVGVCTTRYLLRIEPLASASDDEVVALVGPAVQALLDPTRRPGTGRPSTQEPGRGPGRAG